jgi:hypothetical protein
MGVPSGAERSAGGRRKAAVLAIGFTLAGAVAALFAAWLSDGVHHDDDLAHYQFARWVREYPVYLLHSWGRPGFTALYALPAQLGWPAARCFSVLLTAATAWLAYDIGRRQGVRLAWLAPALLWLGPMSFTLSYTTLTEPVLGFYLTLGMWLLLRGNHALSAATISLCCVTRHEGVLFAALWLVALWRIRRPAREWVWLAWAPAAHNVISFAVGWDVPILMFLQATPTEEYGRGGWLAMLARWPIAAGIGPLTLGLLGAPYLARRRHGMLWVGCAAVYVLAHTVIFRFGLFASAGYFRFLTAVGPVVAVAAAAGVSEAWTLAGALRRSPAAETVRAARRMLAWLLGIVLGLWLAVEWEIPSWLGWVLAWVRQGAAPLVVLLLVALWLCAGRAGFVRAAAVGLPVLMLGVIAVWQPVLASGVGPPHTQCAPLRQHEDQWLLRDAADWLRAQGLDTRTIIATNCWLHEFLGIVVSPHTPALHVRIEQLRPGDLLVWDARYSPSGWNRVSLEQLRRRPDFVELWRSRPHSHHPLYCVIFEKRAAAATSASASQPSE